jgi:hypothetical protein
MAACINKEQAIKQIEHEIVRLRFWLGPAWATSMEMKRIIATEKGKLEAYEKVLDLLQNNKPINTG